MRTRVGAPRLRKGSTAPFAIARGKGVSVALSLGCWATVLATLGLSAKMAKAHVERVAVWASWLTRWVREGHLLRA